MKELIDRISHPKPWMIIAFCFVTIFAILAFPLQNMRSVAQSDKEKSAQLEKGGKIEPGSEVNVLSIDPRDVPPNLGRDSKSAMAPAVAGQLFSATLSGNQEVPANTSTAFGTATAVLSEDQASVTVNVNFSGLTGGAATAAHIHGSAVPGANAGVQIALTSFPAATSGTYSSTFAITPAQVTMMQGGLTYINIHNAGFPGGELRGQLGLSQPGDVEPNGTAATASPIPSSARVRGNIIPNGDVDFYSFFATAGSKVYAAVQTSGSANASTDSQLRLIGADGTTVIEFDEDDGSLGGLSSTIAGATIPTGGTFYLQVNHFSATNQLRPYDLYFRLQQGAPTPEVEANDTPATANVLPASGWVSGARNPAVATEQDWYSFTANAGDTVYLGMDMDPERDNVQWDGRLGIALFGDANNQILVVNDASTGSATNPLSEALFFTVKTAGTYFAFVDSASAAVGGPTATYNLSVTVLPKVNEGTNCTTYTSTDVPKTIGTEPGLVSSTLTVPGNPRIADLDVSIQLNHTRMADIDAHLRSPAGNDNGLFTDIGSAAVGGQTQMDVTFDDEAAIPPVFTALRGTNLQTEIAHRLSWFDGENAGGTWTLDLRDDSAAEGGTLTGWSMTICEQPPPPACPVGFAPTTVFSTDFESGAAGFTHSGTADEWELGLPATLATTTANPVAAFNSCNSGVNCWKTDLDNTYDISSTQDLLSPAINLTGISAPITVTWAQRYQMESANFDRMFVDAQQVGGATPVRLFEYRDATMVNGPGNPTVNVPASAGWGVFSRRADSLAGLNTELRFHLDSDTSINFAGMAVDDVTVTGCRVASADLQITKTNGVASVTAGGSTTYTITASNAGPDPVLGATVADTFPASLTVAGWTCVGAGGGTCTAAGSGNINDTNVNLPVGGSVTYTAPATISAGASGTLVNTATVSSSVTDPTPANNSATDTDTITPSGVGIQLCTLTAGGATYNIPSASHYDATQTSNFTGVGTGDYLFEDGWWFRVAGDTQESFFPVPTATNCTGANGTVTWTNVSARGLFDATNTLTLSSAGANQGQLILTMAITNTTASPLTISLFHGADFDVNGTAGTDNATLVSPNTHIRVTDSTAGNAEQRAFNPAANAFLVRPFAATTDVFGVLGDAAVTNFDNTTLPSSNFDYTGAFQWNLVIPAGGTSSVSTALVTNVPATAAGVNVGGRVLTPEGRGVRGAIVTITDQNGVSHTVTTGVNGNFVFDDVEPGQTYVVNIRSRRFTFSPQVVQVNDNIADLQFVAGQ
ncbi:MAG: CHRD domain-containing protein [Pyrinomonadaceae bacterium]